MTDPVMQLSQVHGDGRVTFHALTAAGFHTLASIAGVPVERLADRARLSLGTAERLRAGAREMLGLSGGPSRGAPATGERVAGRTSASRGAVLSEGVREDEARMLGQGESRPTIVSHGMHPPAPTGSADAVRSRDRGSPSGETETAAPRPRPPEESRPARPAEPETPRRKVPTAWWFG